MFKTETHIHTAEVSICSHKKAREMVRIYKERGYSTICITDHFQGNTLDSYGDIPWQEKMSIFLGGYYRAKVEGEKIGINVLAGAELCFPGNPNHYLAYGITKQFLDANPNINKTSIEYFSEVAHKAGIFIIQAHPYRESRSIDHIRLFPRRVHGVEVYNAGRRESENVFAATYCRHYELIAFAGTDNHVGGNRRCFGGMATDRPIGGVREFIEQVRSGEAKPFRRDENGIGLCGHGARAKGGLALCAGGLYNG